MRAALLHSPPGSARKLLHDEVDALRQAKAPKEKGSDEDGGEGSSQDSDPDTLARRLHKRAANQSEFVESWVRSISRCQHARWAQRRKALAAASSATPRPAAVRQDTCCINAIYGP
jgi:hypothetical protein